MRKLRQVRVGELLREVISDIIRTKIKDPRLQGITITDVEMTADLKTARVYYCRLGKGEDPACRQGLEHAEGFIRRLIRSELDLKYIPQLSFFYDTSFDTYARIDGILKGLEKTRSDEHSEDSSHTEE